MRRIKDAEIDAIITSPPYLNAIDYMRGHKFSLIWFGHKLSELRRIRREAIGTERTRDHYIQEDFETLSQVLGFDKLKSKNIHMLERYFGDLRLQLQETKRVLKRGATALYVIGNSAIQGRTIENNELIKRAAYLAGLKVVSETVRDIPTNKRYLPINVHTENSLSKRMRTEHVISLLKPT